MQAPQIDVPHFQSLFTHYRREKKRNAPLADSCLQLYAAARNKYMELVKQTVAAFFKPPNELGSLLFGAFFVSDTPALLPVSCFVLFCFWF